MGGNSRFCGHGKMQEMRENKYKSKIINQDSKETYGLLYIQFYIQYRYAIKRKKPKKGTGSD